MMWIIKANSLTLLELDRGLKMSVSGRTQKIRQLAHDAELVRGRGRISGKLCTRVCLADEPRPTLMHSRRRPFVTAKRSLRRPCPSATQLELLPCSEAPASRSEPVTPRARAPGLRATPNASCRSLLSRSRLPFPRQLPSRGRQQTLNIKHI